MRVRETAAVVGHQQQQHQGGVLRGGTADKPRGGGGGGGGSSITTTATITSIRRGMAQPTTREAADGGTGAAPHHTPGELCMPVRCRPHRPLFCIPAPAHGVQRVREPFQPHSATPYYPQ